MTTSRTVSSRSLNSARSDDGDSSLQTGVGLVSLVPLLALLGVTVGTNTPLGPRLPLESLRTPIEVAAYLGPSVGAILLGISAESEWWQVALLTAGVFGGLAVLSSTASILAIWALLGAITLIIYEIAFVKSGGFSGHRVVSIAFGTAVLFSMLGSLGFEPALVRKIASLLVAGGLLGLPLITGHSYRSVFLGLIGATVIAVIGITVPVMTAAVSLLGMGVVGIPLVLLVGGAAGGLTGIFTALEERQFQTALAGGLVLVAGVPSTVPTAIGIVVALGVFSEVCMK